MSKEKIEEILKVNLSKSDFERLKTARPGEERKDVIESLLERKAFKCVRLAKRQLPLDASEDEIEKRALELMDNPESSFNEILEILNYE